MKNLLENIKTFFGVGKNVESAKNETIVDVKPQVTEKKSSVKQSKPKKKSTEEIPTITLDTVTITASKKESEGN
jgi:hypothetical protein